MWLGYGLPYPQFWDLTVAEIVKILRGKSDAEKHRVEQARAMNYELAGLIACAYHDPENMPKFKPDAGPDVVPDDAAAQANLRGFLMGLAAR